MADISLLDRKKHGGVSGREPRAITGLPDFTPVNLCQKWHGYRHGAP